MHELQKQINVLKEEISSLKKQIVSFNQSSTISLEVERSFTGRGFVKTEKSGIPDPDGDYTTNIGFRRNISLSGESQTITVPAYPVRFMRLTDGSNLYIPLHTYAEFGF